MRTLRLARRLRAFREGRIESHGLDAWEEVVTSPAGVSDWVITVLMLGSLAGALWILGVRDWRVFGATLLWPPVVSAYQTANVTLPLCLLCALIWRGRHRAWLPGIVLGAALAIKFFLWPLAVWLAAMRRLRASVASVAIAAASLLLIEPFIAICTYVDLLRKLSNTFAGGSYTIYAFLLELGAGSMVARTVTLAAGGGMLLLRGAGSRSDWLSV